MAIHKSDIITAKDSLNISDKSVDGTKTGATVLRATAVYTMKGTEINGDVIELTELPPSAVVLPYESSVSFGYSRGFRNGTLSLGDTQNARRYGSATVDFYGTTGLSAAFGYDSYGNGVTPEPYEKTTRLTAIFEGTPSDKLAGGKVVFGINYLIKG